MKKLSSVAFILVVPSVLLGQCVNFITGLPTACNGSGTGTVTSITCGAGLTGGTITTSGTCAVSGSLSLFDMTKTSATVETLCSTCSSSTPGIISNNNVTTVITTPATVTISGASTSDTVFWYLANGNIPTIGHNSATTLTASAGWAVVNGITSIPPDAVNAFWQTTFTANVWDTIVPATMDLRSQFKGSVNLAGTGILKTYDGSTGNTTWSIDVSPPLTTPRVTTINDTNGNPFIASTATASAVDGITITNAATANPADVTVGATGSDSNINLNLVAKGTGYVNIPGTTLRIQGGTALLISGSTITLGSGYVTNIVNNLLDVSGGNFKMPTGAGFTATSTNMFGFDSTNTNPHIWDGADGIIAPFAASPTTGRCVQTAVVSGKVTLVDSGSTNCGGGGATALSAVTAAVAGNTIANGDNAQVWNWATTTSGKIGMKFGETTASTSAGTPYGVQISTLIGSTATPLNVANSLNGSQTLPALMINPTWNTTGVVDAALLINPTNTASGAASKLIDAQVGGTTQWNVDKGGNTIQVGSITTGSGSGVAGSISLQQGTAPTVLANTFAWTAPTTITTAVQLQSPNAVPAANQVMLFPAPTSNVSQWTWTGFTSTNLTDTALLARLASPTFTGTPAAPTPASTDNSTTLSTTAYVTTAITNAINAAAGRDLVTAATNAVLPNTPTFTHVDSGIGSFLTSSTNSALVVDGYTAVLNDRILVKNEATAANNGIYKLTQLGVAAVTPWILTRALDYDQPSDMNNTIVPVANNGTANPKTSWIMTSVVATVDTDAVNFSSFTPNGGNIVTAVSPGVGLGHFAGSTQTLTSSLVVSADLNITTSTCTYPSVLTAISATVVGTCTVPTIPQNSQSTAYTTVLGDAGKHIYHPVGDNNARTFTIDSNANVAYPVGTTLTFMNEINTLSIAITTDTMVLAGTATTGTRTLAAGGIATALKVTSTRWIINGTGLT